MTALSNEQIADTLVLPYLNHAVRMYEDSYASRADIDAGMRFGCGYPEGPLATIDRIGVESVRDRLAARYAETGDELHRPAETLEKMVADGRLGTESGRGFYTWSGGGVVADGETPDDADAPRLRREITKVGVVGTGTMASGIVEVFAKGGYDVVYVGRSDEKVAAVRARVEKSLDKAISKGKLEESGKEEVLGRLTGSTSREDLSEVDLVVEAIAEELEIKQELFADLDRICKPGAILATTTSSLPVTECASATGRPQDVIGMHFFNPAPVMKLVEVVTTEQTVPDADETVKALSTQVGKVPVSCGDRAGFIVNALLFPYLNDAVKLLESGQATVEEIDAAVKEHANLPMGPFQLLDVVGNDVALAITEELHREFGHAGFKPATTLEKIVAEGHLGRKSGRGFHDYS